MKLLEAVRFRAQRLIPSAERGTAIAVVGLLVGLEIVGRNATSDWHDLLGGVALLLGVMFVVAWHRSDPVPWVSKLLRFGRRQANRFDQLKYDVGIDFRGTPPIPQHVPRAVWWVVLGFVVCNGLALAAWHAFPEGWRELGQRTSYVLYLVVLMTLWIALLTTVALGVYLPVYVFDHHMRRLSASRPGSSVLEPEPTPPSPDAAVILGYWILAMLVTLVTPPIYGLALCGLVGALGVLGCLMPGGKDANILWRVGGTPANRELFSIPMRRVLALGVVLASLLVATVILWACGGQLSVPPSLESSMVVTGFLGAMTAWLVPGLVLVGGYQLVRFRRTDPTRREPPTVRIDAIAEPRTGIEAAKAVRRWGFRTVFAPLPVAALQDPPTVGLQIVPPEQSEATEFDPRWPLKVALGDLTGDLVKQRVARRDEIQLRRRFLRCISKLLKQSALIVPEHGGGFWVAPHWWFIQTLLWEAPPKGKNADQGAILRPVGPSFSKLFGPRVRQQIHAILRASQVDLIYIEDGVTPRKFEKVLRELFELYDIHGGTRRAEDHHFQGIPRIRVMIHDYAPGNDFRSDLYPEPKFDDVSRFRVLHVFRDRGESEELLDAPFDFSWEPSPMAIH
jgi:hypothetical protein